MDRLRSFVATGTIPASARKRHLQLTIDQLADIFTLNLALSALYVRSTVPDVSEEALDALCVANLIQFPPVEGGPLNFAARISQKKLLSMYDKYIQAVPFLVDFCKIKNPQSSLLSEKSFETLFDGKRSAPSEDRENKEDLTELFKGQRCEVNLLSQAQLRKIGRARGVQSWEVFLLPALLLVLVPAVLFSLLWTGYLATWWLVI